MEALPDANVRVLVVWEPILSTDWAPPTRGTLARIPDGRVRQFWDRHHLAAEELRRSAAAHPGITPPTCCFDKGFYWDVAVLFAPQQSWKTTLPSPIFWEGPIAKNAAALEKSLRGSLASLLCEKNAGCELEEVSVASR